MIATSWAALSLGMKVLWAVTLSASLIFVIQSVMTFIGLGSDMDSDLPDEVSDGSFDADPSMNLLTFRNLVNFLIGFGWSAILLKDKISSIALLAFVALLIGVALVVLVMYLFKWLYSMQASGNINVRKDALGCLGSVYLTIPGERSGEGKVQITINNSVREYGAVTDGEALPTGAQIRVVEVISENTLLVEAQNSLII
ncbi:MAG: hypothetical protein MJY67_07490 [Bacteroidales bacterium]|nr:hypothetical protein [Bacteroidales bacterium]